MASLQQRYVSNELTHFTGRQLGTDDERFGLLVKILREGELLAGYSPALGLSNEKIAKSSLNIPAVQHLTSGNVSASRMSGHVDGSLVHETAVRISSLCFCDIPLADLQFHMRRYSMFGIAFDKRFLVERGASPVFYVARDAVVRSSKEGDLHLADVLDDLWPAMMAIQDYLEEDRKPIEINGRSSFDTLSALHRYVFAFIKGFDAISENESEQHYYMEREWRMTHNLHFNLSDVCRVIIPRMYRDRLRKELPDYSGQIHFAD